MSNVRFNCKASMINKSNIIAISIAIILNSPISYAQNSSEGCNLFRFNSGSEKSSATKIQYLGCNPTPSGTPSDPEEPEEPQNEFEQDVVYEFLDGVDPDYWYSSGYTCMTEVNTDIVSYSQSGCDGFLSDEKLFYPDTKGYISWGLEYDENDRVSVTFYKAIQGDNASELRVGNLALRVATSNHYALGIYKAIDSVNPEFQPIGYIEKREMRPVSVDGSPMLEIKKENLHKFQIIYDNGMVSTFFDDILLRERAYVDEFSQENMAVYQRVSQGPVSWWGPLRIHVQRRTAD